ncbi:receptor-transporting protein 3-like isoform X3 [Limulus polyphemus]|nr:receptor-transporting protein 3-like isoform X3 [Limulus polyphemus]XP_022245279.1 receptor-transporting protein 3-like isoform X3 [Limulus polyphemus]XP_022245280.1 receptor-transporting protein 3-like isoform X3 [Limulus polyphemus]
MVWCTSPLIPAVSSPTSPPSVYPVFGQSQFFTRTTVIPVATSPTWNQSFGMEQMWQMEFQRLFVQYLPHLWFLSPVEEKPIGSWGAFVDSAKVRFCCEKCGHGWTSMKGRVAFWFTLNPLTCEGLVVFKLFGQQCDRCNSERYEHAMWYPEEVIKVLANVYNRIGQVYYGFYQPPIHRSRRPGKPRTPHNSNLCQACKNSVCTERR